MRTLILTFLLISTSCTACAQGYIPTFSIPSDIPDNYCDGAKKIFSAYDSGNFSYIKKIASKNKKDPFFFPTCILLEYSAKLISEKEFVEAFPGTKAENYIFVTAIWGCDQPCKIFGRAGVGQPIFPYYDELFKLMAKGNRQAIKKVLDSVPWSDGEVAEMLQDAGFLPDFFAEHADIVLKNRDLFRKNFYLEGSNQDVKEICRKLTHMREVVLKSDGDDVARAEFLGIIENELNTYQKSKFNKGFRKKNAFKIATPGMQTGVNTPETSRK